MKLAKSGSEGEKVFLLLESGSRLHTVQVRPGRRPSRGGIAHQGAHGDAAAPASWRDWGGKQERLQ